MGVPARKFASTVVDPFAHALPAEKKLSMEEETGRQSAAEKTTEV